MSNGFWPNIIPVNFSGSAVVDNYYRRAGKIDGNKTLQKSDQ